eukprot:PhM_4_TR6221/c0_g1_i1/m.74797
MSFRRFLSPTTTATTSTVLYANTTHRLAAARRLPQQHQHHFYSVSTTNTNTTPTTTTTKPPPATCTVEDVTRYLESSPEAVVKVLDRLEPATRRRLIVAGGALEWFGKEDVEKELKDADQDRDAHISPHEFNKWFKDAVQRENGEDNSVPPIPMKILILIAIQTGIPFIGFGFLDNCLMLVAGEMIDSTLGFYLNTSVMASAAMGNVVSGTVGMQVHGIMDRFFSRLGFGVPPLTVEQLQLRSVFLAGHFGGTFGIALGLTLGMLPLMLLPDSEEKQAKKIFAEIDVNNDGRASVPEICHVLEKNGIVIPADEVEAIVVRLQSESTAKNKNSNTQKQQTQQPPTCALSQEEFVTLYKTLLGRR